MIDTPLYYPFYQFIHVPIHKSFILKIKERYLTRFDLHLCPVALRGGSKSICEFELIFQFPVAFSKSTLSRVGIMRGTTLLYVLGFGKLTENLCTA